MVLTPGYGYTATVDDAPIGLVGTLTYELVRIADSSVVIAAATTTIVEAAPGVYIATRTLPTGTMPGDCLHVWTAGATSTTEPVTIGPSVTPLDLRLGAGYHLALGPLRFVTAYNTLKEALGDGYEAVGAAIVATDPKPRPFDLSFPVRGDVTDSDPVATGNMLRRQVRALLENVEAKAGGVYFRFDADPELNGWLMVGGGDLEYDAAGPTFAEYKLTLTDCYVVGRQWTHRPAVRACVLDRRLGTSPRDYRRQVYSTDFAAVSVSETPVGPPRVVLPVGITDPETNGVAITVAELVATRDGDLAAIDGVADSAVYSFEQPEASMGLGDVRIWDRGPTPAVETSWQQVFGPVQPLTAGDVPVLDNGVCRTRLTSTTGPVFALDSWSAGAWVEQARFLLGSSSALVGVSVVSWTPERAVLNGVNVTSGGSRYTWYLTLAHGASGPRFEIYGGGPPVVRVISAYAGAVNLSRSDAGATAITDGTSYGDFTGREPWLVLSPNAGPNQAVGAVVAQAAVVMTGRSDTAVYGTGHWAIDFAGTTTPAYVSVRLCTDTAGSTATAVKVMHRELLSCRAIPTLVSRG